MTRGQQGVAAQGLIAAQGLKTYAICNETIVVDEIVDLKTIIRRSA